MSDKAKGLLRQAIQEYESGDGASRLDTVQMALKADPASIGIVAEGYDMFMEERKDTEALLIDQTPAKELPTLIGRKWEFEENLERLTIQLKKGK